MHKAEAAVDSIKQKDITELKSSKNPVDTTKFIFDAVNLIFQSPITAVSPHQLTISKQAVDFIKDSFEECTKATMINPRFLQMLFDFSKNEKDNINDETCELLEPYLLLKLP